ncbi:uncharacterized protein BX664DRAFT_347988 [Halteromyces radiatus]|uniref:uncharacterized protein n=1 Tax=Halteromyces radiatus TaxID=101107 RepID=UPI00221F25D3|nr:uncharacterized protein BX664DRAFT_347988 [Halteromyces radiatus]KAI8092722.1 hypothetical protein BX664DRAFT_347988 [Halteromyces radiatus]
MNSSSSSFSWDDIRTQVRRLRMQTLSSLSNHNISTCKNFYFHPQQHKLYFLSNCIAPNYTTSRQFVFYQVDYSLFYSKDEPLPSSLPWTRMFDEYKTQDDMSHLQMKTNRQDRIRPLQSLSSFQMVNDTVLMIFMGNIYAGTIGKIPKLVSSHDMNLLLTKSDQKKQQPTTSLGNKALYDTSARTDPKLGGINNDIFTFIRNRDIWISNFDGDEIQLTFCSNQQNESLSCGVAEYVIQEEFHRYTGCYWGPSAKNSDLNRLLYLETDESGVELVNFSNNGNNIIDENEDNPQIIAAASARYPRAGQPNAISKLYILEFTYTTIPFKLGTFRRKQLWGPDTIECLYPWAEYIVRLGWLPNGESVWLQLLPRDQTKTVVIQIPCTLFRTEEEEEARQNTQHHQSQQQHTPKIEELWSEKQDSWVNISDAYSFLESNKSISTHFIWSSELGGFRHLYYVAKENNNDHFNVQQLTSGDWCVVDKPIHVDQRRKLVYFMAKMDTPLETHLYVTTFDLHSIQRPIRRLTSLGYSHTIEMNGNMDVFVDVASSLHQPHGVVLRQLQFTKDDPLPQVKYNQSQYCNDNTINNSIVTIMPAMCDINDIDGDDDSGMDMKIDIQSMIIAQPSSAFCHVPSLPKRHTTNGNSILVLDQDKQLEPHLCHPDNACMTSIYEAEKRMHVIPEGEIFEFMTSDGVKLYGCLYKPRFYQPGKSYPTILHIYGGPKTQMVTNEFKFPRLLRYLMGVYFGFAVVVIDGRGSCDRGLAFESYVKHRLGRVELEDQVQGLEYLATSCFGALPQNNKLVSVVDLNRVAVTGWSYGGYLSLMALAHYSSIFKIAIAGAPVTQWELYDSAYTERYMGMPLDHPYQYATSSVLHWIHQFPNEENRLIVVHGLIDENVHFINSERLVSRLAHLGKPYCLQMYPTEKHGLRHASVNEHFETLMFHNLLNHL